ncbi:hypothetical protein AWI07_03690 [Enterobacter roggenkampii]|uniref:phage tail-collar fiber domain-containing protein n=1 Tax=Enterobacter roggenkampii TaxID=1812935 RepID=UPI0007509889|nr:hypothetical protein AWI07_03690 [Enterobacter roggenkampii]
MSQTVITQAFETLKAQEAANGGIVTLDEFVFASVPNLNITDPIDRTEGLPPAAQIVHRQAVSKTGMVNSNAVVYSVVLGADVGDFEFNWVGLLNKASGVVAMIVHAPSQKKIRTQSGQQGNVLTRSFLMEYNGASQQTQIITPADTWQIDFTARLNGVDERIRLENIDTYGAAAFLGDGFKVSKNGSKYVVKQGVAYIAGLRAELLFDQDMTVSARPSKIWADVCWQGTMTSVWAVQTKLTVAETLADYTDNDTQHHVFAIAEILADGSVIELRNVSVPNALASLSPEKNTITYFDSDARLKLTALSEFVRGLLGSTDVAEVLSALELSESGLDGISDKYISVKQPIDGTVARTQHDKNSEYLTFADFGVQGNGADDTAALQKVMYSGKTVYAPDGVFMATHLTMGAGTRIIGRNYTTIIKQIIGANRDFITFPYENWQFIEVSVDGNYFLNDWRSTRGEVGNQTGNGLVIKARGFRLDVLLNNVAGAGAWFQNPGLENSSARIPLHDISIEGRDFGKEGVVFQGPGDGIIRKMWIGRSGLLPRPAAESTIAMSDIYPGEPVDGIVIDGTTVEIRDIHTYAHWSGTGFRTRNNVRLTKGGRVITESSRSQAYIGQGTYGSLFLDVRNQSLLHPNWAAAVPVYSGIMPEFDMVTIDADFGLKIEMTIRKMKIDSPYVIGARGLVVNGSCETDTLFANSMAKVGPETGKLYSGDAVLYACDHGGSHRLTAQNVNGIAANVIGAGMNIDLNVWNAETGLKRSSATNSMRGNTITGSLYRCGTAFNSVGNPTSEIINLSSEQITGQTPFIGDTPDLNRAQVWNISASVNNVGYSTSRRLSIDIDAATTAAKTAKIAHGFLYKPDFKQVQLTIDDRATPTTAVFKRLAINDITDTEITIAYEFSTSDVTAAANLRANINIS